jgi:ubiquinone/menaquinone biosynthesis C-methylase UbiE
MQHLVHPGMVSFLALWQAISNNRSKRTGVHRKTNCRRSMAMLIATVVLLCSGAARGSEAEIEHLVQVLQLKPGSIVADVGAGAGEQSIALARRLGPQGRVYSTEINLTLLDQIRSLVQKERTTNVIPIAGTEHNTELPAGCCDAIFLRQVYHHLTDPLGIDRSLYQAMRPAARLAIIDFEPNQLPGRPAPPGVPGNRGGHGVPKRIVAEELTRTGFVLLKTIDWPINPAIRHYCMLFAKPAVQRQPLAHLLPSKMRTWLLSEGSAHHYVNNVIREVMFIAEMPPDA